MTDRRNDHSPANPQARGFRVTGRLVLFSVLGFFAVIIGVNATFIAFAAQTFPGLVTDEPFKRGLAKNVNADLEARGALDARGWSIALFPEYAASDGGIPDAGANKPHTGSSGHDREDGRDAGDRDRDIAECEALRADARDEALRRGETFGEADETFYDNLCAQERAAQRGDRGQTRRARPGQLDLSAQVLDQNGTPVPGLALSGKLQRLVTDSADVELAFTSTGPGRYTAHNLRAADGEWLVVLRGTFPDTGAPFVAEARLNLQ